MYFYICTSKISQCEENSENQVKIAYFQTYAVLKVTISQPKYIKTIEILIKRFDYSDESKSRFIL